MKNLSKKKVQISEKFHQTCLLAHKKKESLDTTSVNAAREWWIKLIQIE